MTTEDYLQILFIGIALILDILATRKLIRSTKLIRKVKRVNIILTWIIPYIWAALVLSFNDKPPKKKGNYGKGRYMDGGYSSYAVSDGH